MWLIRKAFKPHKVGSSTSKAVLLATSPKNYDPPSNELVSFLVEHLQTSRELLDVRRRLAHDNWLVALKAELLLHQFLRNATPLAELRQMAAPVAAYHDISEKGAVHSRVLQQYFIFLQMKGELDPSFRANKQMSNAVLARWLDTYLEVLSGIVELGHSLVQPLSNYALPVTEKISQLVFQEGVEFYELIVNLVTAVQHRLPTFYPNEAGHAQSLLKQFQSMNERVFEMFEVLGTLTVQRVRTPVKFAPNKPLLKSRRSNAELKKIPVQVKRSSSIAGHETPNYPDMLELKNFILLQDDSSDLKQPSRRTSGALTPLNVA